MVTHTLGTIEEVMEDTERAMDELDAAEDQLTEYDLEALLDSLRVRMGDLEELIERKASWSK